VNRVLADTQALIWFADGSSALSAKARSILDDPALIQVASAASLWEMAIKVSLGKLILKSGTLREFSALLKANDIEVLAVSAEDAMGVADLPSGEHKDPFDRLIAAQCLRHDPTLVSIDTEFDAYGVRRVW